jgi:hypothetical protein
MAAIGASELENARAARHLFLDHPWLNLKVRLDGDYPDSVEMIDTKIALLEAALAAARMETSHA